MVCDPTYLFRKSGINDGVYNVCVCAGDMLCDFICWCVESEWLVCVRDMGMLYSECCYMDVVVFVIW